MKKLTILGLLITSFVWGQTPLERLENSPRHHEWITVSTEKQEVKSFLNALMGFVPKQMR